MYLATYRLFIVVCLLVFWCLDVYLVGWVLLAVVCVFDSCVVWFA